MDKGTEFLKQLFNTDFDFAQGKIMDITPEYASRMLDRNSRNRNIRDVHVKWLAKQMELGYWCFTGDPIRFGTDGVLLDKQHTLNAIILSGTKQRFMVLSGLEPEIFAILDTGISRTAGDALHMKGIPNANNVAAVCRRVLAFKNKSYYGAFDSSSGNKKVESTMSKKSELITNMIVLEEVTKNQRYQECTTAAGTFYKSFPGVSQSRYGMLLFILGEKSAEDAYNFLSQFASGLGLVKDSPVNLLRKRFEQQLSSTIKYQSNLQLYWFINCWNKYRTGETMKVLQTPAKIQIPEIL